jgi:hypothetical protein
MAIKWYKQPGEQIMSRLTLDEHSQIIAAKWKHPNKYKKKIKVTDQGHGCLSIGWDKTDREILNEIKADDQNIKEKFKSLFRFF